VPHDITLRPLTRDDIPAWARVLAAAEAVDRTGEHYNEADLAEEMDNPEIVVGKDVVGAFDGAGDGAEMVGYFSILPRGEGEGLYKIHVEGTVVPERRGQGVGTLLRDAMVARAEAAYAERGSGLPLKLMTTGKTDNAAQADLLESVGFTGERWSFVMRTLLDRVAEPPVLPDGYELRTYDDSRADDMRRAHNAAFTAHHPNFTPWTEATWKQWVTESRNFRPGLSFLVVLADTDEIVGYAQSNEFDAYFEATGRREAYVGKLGVLAEHRGRGIAAALLGHCLVAYRDAGFDEASLDVDSENPTGALGVYERAGFGVESRWTNYQRVAG
jgi:mycothiol synthase